MNLVSTEYLVQGAAAAVSPSFTLSVADTWSVLIVAYKPAGGVANTLAAAAGSYAVTGDAAALIHAAQAAFAAGAYAITGDAALLSVGLAPAAGAYVISGAAIRTVAAKLLGLASGAYGINGLAALLASSNAPVAPAGTGGPPPTTTRRKFIIDARPGRGPTAHEIRARMPKAQVAELEAAAQALAAEAPDTLAEDILDVLTVLLLVGEL